MWTNECKPEVEAFANQIKNTKDGLLNSNGMTAERTMRLDMEVPSKLHGIIAQMTHRDWIHDKQIYNMVKQLIPSLLPYNGKNMSRVMIDKVSASMGIV